ncbi:MAG: 2-oxo acid dehydrogenase subunit E2 [Myxococcales bacterium]|nr:2-oxo acid dehydrogenase subunit E2 [Myxococcales bacterium]
MSRLSPVRRFALWLFSEPAIAHVSTNILIDFAAAQAYLARLNDPASGREGPRISVQHLFTATVGRLLREFPIANGRVVGRRIERFDRVNIAAPVDLLDHDAAGPMELGMMILEGVDRMTLVEVAERTRRVVHAERGGRPSHPLVRLGLPIAERLPAPVFDAFLDATGWIAQSRLLAPLLRDFLQVSTIVSNPGAAFREIEGGRFLGGAMVPPTRLIPIGTIFGVSALQPELFVVDGAPAVRPGLPLIFIFDHRLFDGVICSRILKRLAQMLQDPAVLFGEDGRLPPPA